MCDPMSIIGLGLSIGMAYANYSAQQEMMDNQNAANAAWVSYQQSQAREYAARDEQLRKNADAARQASLEELTPEQQTKAQENEEGRLKKMLTPEDTVKESAGDKLAIDKKLLSGQQNTAGPVAASIQASIQKAAVEARERIAALAAVQSYGGSQFGLTNRANAILNASGQEIREESDKRQGRLAAHQVVKAVEPIRYAMQGGGGGLGGIAGQLGKMGGTAAGTAAYNSGLGTTMAGMLGGGGFG